LLACAGFGFALLHDVGSTLFKFCLHRQELKIFLADYIVSTLLVGLQK